LIIRFFLSEDSIDPAALRLALPRNDAGGYCSFEGWARDHNSGKNVLELTYEAYVPLALKQGEMVMHEAFDRFEILEASASHRTGSLVPGELAVWVGVCSAHRAAAFEACRFLIDRIKETVPIWKLEAYSDGTNEWLDPTACGCAKTEEVS
jgi:molybdopterin synthase catalytic subunit